MLLDEPSLYMHPSLERRLLAVLTDPTQWSGSPLRLVAITHSRIWADAAMRKGSVKVVDWENQSESKATIRSAGREAIQAAPSEIVHGLPILFVEGVSDKAALELLGRDVPLACTVVSLKITDLFLKGGTLGVLGRTAGDGFGQPTRLLVDRDKEKAVKAAEQGTHASECPDIFFAGASAGQDLESCFCTREFLSAYIRRSAHVALPAWEEPLAAKLAALSAGRAKGDSVVEWVFTVALEQDLQKDAFLSELTAYAQKIRGQAEAAQVWLNLADVLKALDATNCD